MSDGEHRANGNSRGARDAYGSAGGTRDANGSAGGTRDANGSAGGAGDGERQEGPAFRIHMVGVNHRTAPARVREALARSENEAAHWIRLTAERGAVDVGGSSVREVALLSTCNRTEAYLVLTPGAGAHRAASDEGSDLHRHLVRLLCGPRSELLEEPATTFYSSEGDGAVRHLFRVAAGLDSMIQGEPQVLGQVHRAHELAREADGTGPVLDRLFANAFHAGKRARSESDIGRGTVSVAATAVDLAIKVVGPLARRTALVIGAGQTGRLVATHLAAAGTQAIWVANRTFERARRLAEEIGGRAIPIEDLERELSGADIVVVATASPEPLVTTAMARSALRRRRRSTVFIDISMPRNVDPTIHGFDNAFVYDLDALQRIVDENIDRRREEAAKVERLLDEEVEQYSRWLCSLSAGPLIGRLREHFEDVRREEVRRHARHLSPEQLEAVERATRGLLNKLLHGPTVHLRNGGSSDPESLELVRKIFQLREHDAACGEVEESIGREILDHETDLVEPEARP